GIDPVGCCVGLRGIRIQNIVNELGGEKIDIIMWNPSTSAFIASALSPAQVLSVELNDEEKVATVVIPDKQLSLAIGKEGQNVRLAAKLIKILDDHTTLIASGHLPNIIFKASQAANNGFNHHFLPTP
ncbi:unnamed protein product, partial [marine sediment metagenome]